MLIAGWSDASSGPLLPYIQSYFRISYTIVSMFFVRQMVGFVVAGLSASTIIDKIGLGRTVTLGAMIQAVGFVFLVPAWTFPVMPVCYAVLGFGMALQDSCANVYIAVQPRAEWKLGWLHASYGLGALICPLAATAFVSSGIKFSYFYIVSIGLALVNIAVLLYAFRFSYRLDEHTVDVPVASSPEEPKLVSDTDIELSNVHDTSGTTTPSVDDVQVKDKRSNLRQTLTNRTVLACAAFTTLYVGAEVSMGGWIVTFLIDNRGAGPEAGYVATAFWSGLMAGRVVLTPINLWVGERTVVWLYLFIATGLEFAIWFARDFAGNVVTVFLVGLIIGPLYPIVMSVCTKVLPRHLHASGISFIAAFGQTGSALFPFITGALSQRFSPAALQPVLVVLFVSQGLIWLLCPKVERKKE